MTRTFTATIWREDGEFVALCPELDVASRGGSVEEARENLKEASNCFSKRRPLLKLMAGSNAARRD